MFTIDQITRWTGGEWIHDNNLQKNSFSALSTDTRTLPKGSLYLPLVGEKFDGHDFLDQAIEAGAVASLWAKHHALPDTVYPLLLVDDTLQALQDIAAGYRKTLPCMTIGLTGSNGKTTTKEILAALFAEVGTTQKTQGNLNNAIGVPKTVLSLEKDCKYAIVEMGVDRPDDMPPLTQIAQPQYALVLNVGDVHLELLGNKEGVAREKLRIVEGMPSDGTLIYNMDDPILSDVVSHLPIAQSCFTFGTSAQADFNIADIQVRSDATTFTVNGIPYRVPLVGAHQAMNAGAAIACALLCGIQPATIQNGLSHVQGESMRCSLIHNPDYDLFVDCYKSNPPSLESAVKTAASLEGYTKKILILGDMLELGPDEAALHRECGAQLDPLHFSDLLCFGDLSKFYIEGATEFSEAHKKHFSSKEALVQYAKSIAVPRTLFVIKASRGLRFEEIVEGLCPEASEQIKLTH